jgi:hypothetical protein
MVTPDVDLRYAPRAHDVDPLREAAARHAWAHAGRMIPLPLITIIWVHDPNPHGLGGEVVPNPDGRVAVYLNASAHAGESPWAIARALVHTMLHEARHAADVHAGLLPHVLDEHTAEARAEDFAGAAMKTFRWGALMTAIEEWKAHNTLAKALMASGMSRKDAWHRARGGKDWWAGTDAAAPLPDLDPDAHPGARNGVTPRSAPGRLPTRCVCGGFVLTSGRTLGRCGRCNAIYGGI